MNNAPDPNTTLATLATRNQVFVSLFDRLQFDYCCGGSQTLAQAAEGEGLDPQTLSRVLGVVEEAAATFGSSELPDWSNASVGEVCDHIVADYHDPLRREIPLLGDLMEKVVRIHGAEVPELAATERAFIDLRDEIEAHIDDEERRLFPALRSLEAIAMGSLEAHNPSDIAMIEKHVDDHGRVGEGLKSLRELSGNYDRSRAQCATHRLLYERLERFESEMHRHVHEENNVLFPRAESLAHSGIH